MHLTSERKQIFFRLGGISEPEFWDDVIPDSIDEATVMPRDCPRVLKTHLSFDMLPSQVLKRQNKVQGCHVNYADKWQGLTLI